MGIPQVFFRRQNPNSPLLIASREAKSAFRSCHCKWDPVSPGRLWIPSQEGNWPRRSRSRETCPLEKGIGGPANSGLGFPLSLPKKRPGILLIMLDPSLGPSFDHPAGPILEQRNRSPSVLKQEGRRDVTRRLGYAGSSAESTKVKKEGAPRGSLLGSGRAGV